MIFSPVANLMHQSLLTDLPTVTELLTDLPTVTEYLLTYQLAYNQFEIVVTKVVYIFRDSDN